jgi:phosphocarrier protein HPr
VFAEEKTVFDQPGAQTAQLTICNAKGLHARASAKFVQTAEAFDAEIAVRCKGQAVDGRSIMGLMMLCASKGTDIEIAALGSDAAEALNTLGHLVGDGFGETDDPQGDSPG